MKAEEAKQGGNVDSRLGHRRSGAGRARRWDPACRRQRRPPTPRRRTPAAAPQQKNPPKADPAEPSDDIF